MEIVKVDALEWVRGRAGQFFASGVVEPVYLLAYLMADVLELGGGTCVIFRQDDWWIVGSEVDWLRHDQFSTEELFRHVVPAPRHGNHSMRGEILVAAFSKHVAVLLDGNSEQIKGEKPSAQASDRAATYHRALMFSL